MKKITLFSALVALAFSANAQSDITPEHFDFSKWSVGALSTTAKEINTIDVVSATRLSPTNVTDALNHGGAIQLFQANFSAVPEHADIATIKSGLSIIDLGGSVGKVLCFKGKNSTYGKGTAATAELAVPNFELRFHLDPTTTQTGSDLYFSRFPGGLDYELHAVNSNTARAEAIIRTTIVFKIIDNKLDNVEKKGTTTKVKLFFGNGSVGTEGTYSSAAFADFKEDQETGEYPGVYVEDRWLEVSTDGYVNKDPAKPYIFSFALNEDVAKKHKLDDKTVLIKSIKMNSGFRLGDSNFYPSLDKVGNVDGGFTAQNANTSLPQITKAITLKEASSIGKIESAIKPYYTATNGQVTLCNLPEGSAVTIVSVSGQQVSSFVAQGNMATISLNKGYYLANIGGKETLKLVVY